jgi:hypothetical protein
MLEVSMEEIEKIMFLMTKYQFDEVSIGTLKVNKSQHAFIEQPVSKQSQIDDEALLFYSSDT